MRAGVVVKDSLDGTTCRLATCRVEVEEKLAWWWLWYSSGVREVGLLLVGVVGTCCRAIQQTCFLLDLSTGSCHALVSV